MAKYSYEFKKKVVMAYLNGEGGTPYLCEKYGIADTKNLRVWISIYKKFGDEGLMRSRKKTRLGIDKNKPWKGKKYRWRGHLGCFFVSSH